MTAKPPPSTGPYMIQSYKPARSIVFVRNPSYRSLEPSVPDGNPDKVVVSIVEDDTLRMDETLGGRYDYDFPPIPFDRLSTVSQKYAGRLLVYTGANTYYFFMNTRVKPFDNIRVRKAVNYAIDRAALVSKFGGLAEPTQNVLPPVLPQYRKLALYDYDLEKARQLIADAGAKKANVVVWGSNRPAALKAVEYLVDQLNKIGLHATTKIVDGSTYWDAIGNQSNAAAIGFADWFEDYPHPLNWFQLLDGHAILPKKNQNYANANVPAITRLIQTLSRQTVRTAAVNAQWATLDRLVVEQALWAPFANRNFTALFSARVDPSCEVVHVVYDFDWSTVCMKQ
jgi:peptide/nickel transport system substrate-binding protein